MWLQSTSASERRVLLATYAGYGLDGFDLMIYSFIIPTLLTLWSMSKAQAGYIATGALVTSAIGGWAAGVLADRFGRARVLQLTVLWFAVFTFLSGFTHNFGELFVTRALQGLGFGGEWWWALCWSRKSSTRATAARQPGWCKAVGRWDGRQPPWRSGR
jgi:MFS family permease